jgi:long-chain acyl-CoA synthetase
VGDHVTETEQPLVPPVNPTQRRRPRTIAEVFRDQVSGLATRPALRHRVGTEWEITSWAEYGQTVDRVGAGLVALGVAPDDRVGILSSNRLEWHMGDLATMFTRAVTVPVYPTSSADQVTYMLDHSEARVCFVEGREQLAKVLELRDALPHLERVITFDADGCNLDDPFLMCWADVCSLGEERLASAPALVDDRVQSIKPDDLATIVYTSGTTGRPKGAMITHANLVATLESLTDVVPIGPDDRFLSFLPLSHIAERTVSHFGQVWSGGQTWFARDLAALGDDLPACRPTVFFAVPRVWEKFRDAVLAQIAQSSGPARRLAERYLALSRADDEERSGGARLSLTAKAQHLVLERAVGGRIRHAMGLDRARILVSGAAPIHPDLLHWLHGINLHVGEVYGQTEDCGPTSLNPPGAVRIGTVGPPLPGVQVRIAEDGEILVKGDNVCRGYLKDPKATEELIDADGWMHSGDVGHFDPAGYLVITDRKKDLIITAHGKNIAPQEIETRLCFEPLISQALVIGEERPYVAALITLDADAIAPWAREHNKTLEPEALIGDPDLQAEVAACVERVNRDLSHAEAVKRWRVLPHDFTIAEGELTPTLKVKRPLVTERYADVIAELYAEPDRSRQDPGERIR